MLALLVAVVLTAGVSFCSGGVVGVLPGSGGIVHGAVPHIGVLPAGSAPGATVTTVVKSTGTGAGALGGVGVGVGAVGVGALGRGLGPLGAVPAIPQYARTFSGQSGYIRDQWENRDGAYVRGGYSMVDVDGSLVVVEYSSDPISGFKVVVKRRGYPDYYLDSVYLGGPLPGGYLPPFYSDFGLDYSDDYYGYDFDSYYGGIGFGYIPSYYDNLDYGYNTYAPGYLDTYDYDLDYDFDTYRRRRSARRV